MLWEDDSLCFDHILFLVVNQKVYDCQHGVDRHVREKKRNQTVSLFVISIFQPSLVLPLDMFMCFSCRVVTMLIEKMELANFFKNLES